jgi:hypothetical protein
LIPTAITAGASRVASGLLCVHAIAITPAGSMELVRSSISIDCGLPCDKASAPAIVLSRPAQRSLTLWPARSPSRHATLYTESSDSFVASAAASIATGWSEPVPGRELHPLKSSAFHGALYRQLWNQPRTQNTQPSFSPQDTHWIDGSGVSCWKQRCQQSSYHENRHAQSDRPGVDHTRFIEQAADPVRGHCGPQ